jgi:uncharacterized protein
VKPMHFDLTVADLAEARRFFEQVMGWKFERFPMPYEIYFVTAGAVDEPGINGTMGAVKDSPICGGRPMVCLTVPVDDVDATISAIEANGGKVIEPKMAIPGRGWYATCAEPGGLMFGIMREDADAS